MIGSDHQVLVLVRRSRKSARKPSTLSDPCRHRADFVASTDDGALCFHLLHDGAVVAEMRDRLMFGEAQESKGGRSDRIKPN
jgi:hypothetical protein